MRRINVNTDKTGKQYIQLQSLRTKLLSITEYPFLFLCAAYLVRRALTTTMLSVQLPRMLNGMVFSLLILVAVFRAACQFRDKRTWAALALAALYFVSWDRNTMPFIALLTVGCIGIPYRKVLVAFLAAVGSMLAGTVLFALSGSVINLISVRRGQLRSYMGTISPTDLGAMIFLLSLAAWVCLKKLPGCFAFILPAASFFVIRFLTHARTGMICSAALFLMALYLLIDREVMEKKGRLHKLRKAVDFLTQAAFPVCMAAAFGLTFWYAKGLPYAGRLNSLLSGRLDDNARYFEELRITPLGYAFSQVGNGGSSFAPREYSWIDVSYLRVFYMYGFVTLLVMCVLWVLFTRRALKAGDRRLAFALALIAIQSFSEHHFMEVHYNIFLILPFAELAGGEVPSIRTGGTVSGIHRYRWVKPTVWAMGLCGGLMLLPRVLSSLNIWNDQVGGTETGRLLLLFGVILLLWAGAFFVRDLGCMAESLASRTKTAKRNWICPAVLLAAFVLVGVSNDHMIRAGMEAHAAVLEADADAIRTISSAKRGKLYAAEYTELYAAEFEGVSRSVFSGEDLARYRDTTVIVPENRDSGVFRSKGFLYSKISDAHAVYTNDESVMRALEEAGYSITGYCPTVNKVELEQRIDDVVLIPSIDGAVHLGGDSGLNMFQSNLDFFNGYDVDFPSGRYTVTFRLSVDPALYETDYPVCHLTVSSPVYKTTLWETTVYRSWFDADGSLDAKLVFETGNTPAIVFAVQMKAEEALSLREITWQRTPLYDVRPTYDARGLLMRETYYDLKGDMTTNRDGYASCSYEFNKSRAITAIHYYDEAGQPAEKKGEYSDLYRSYDDSGRRIREEYFHPDQSRAVTACGYSAIEWEYDSKGNICAEKYLDTALCPVMITDGYSEVRSDYDEDGNMTTELYYDTQERSAVLAEGYSGINYTYDEDGVLIELVFLDAKGNPVRTTQGFTVIKRSSNDAGQLVFEEYCDSEGQPVATTCGYSARERIYDGSGRVWMYRYYDKQVFCPEMPQLHCEYNDLDLLTEAICLAENGEKMQCAEGFSTVRFEYDAFGARTGVRFYALNGNEVDLSEEQREAWLWCIS